MASLQGDSDNVLNVATTLEHVSSPLHGATDEKGFAKPVDQYLGSKTDADQQALLVATNANLSYEKFLSQYPDKSSSSTDNKAARRTSPPHLWEHSEPEPELDVATQSLEANTPHEQNPEPETEISHIIRVASDVLCSLEAHLQDHGIEQSLNLGSSVFPEPIVKIVSEEKPLSDTQFSSHSSEDDTVGKYYEVLNPEGDDIMFISHSDIMRNKCSVRAKLLSENDIALWTKSNSIRDELITAQPRPKYRNMDTVPESSSSSSGEDTISKHCPGHKPSHARMQSQAYIRKRKITLQSNPCKSQPTSNMPKAGNVDSDVADSDATIIYSPGKWTDSDVEPLLSLQSSISKPENPIGKLTVKFFGLSKKPKCKRAYTCPVCGNKSGSVMNFNVHYRTSHPPVKCTNCDKMFATPLSLKHHGYDHLDKDKKCPKCGKKFIFSSQLTAHIKTHRKLKPFICSYIKGGVRCQKDFNYIGDLNRHEAQHKDKALKCKFCKYMNKDKQNLKQHMRTHSDVKPYLCTKCSKAFRYWQQWKRHTNLDKCT